MPGYMAGSILPSAANAVSATDVKRLCHDDQGGQIMKKLGLLATVIAAISFSAAPASADLDGALKQNTQVDGETTILFTSAFKETDYVLGDKVVVVVHGHVVAGVATFKEVGFKGERCCAKKVDADLGNIAPDDGLFHDDPIGDVHHGVGHRGEVELEVEFTELRGDCLAGKGKGTAHLKFRLNIAKGPFDSDPIVIDDEAGYGFNVRVREDPTMC